MYLDTCLGNSTTRSYIERNAYQQNFSYLDSCIGNGGIRISEVPHTVNMQHQLSRVNSKHCVYLHFQKPAAPKPRVAETTSQIALDAPDTHKAFEALKAVDSLQEQLM